jgi:flagellar biosynthesis protein FlhG
VSRLEDLLVEGGVPGLSVIAGASDMLDAANPKHAQKAKLLRHLMALDFDYVLLDLGAGTSFNVLDFFLLADHGIAVLLPEPTSVENAYRFVKAAFFRSLANVDSKYGITELVAAAMNRKQGEGQTPHDLVATVRERDPELAGRLEQELLGFRAKLIVNQARTAQDQNVGNAVAAAWKKFFGLQMDYLGAIGYDDDAWRAIRKRRPILLERPDSPAALGLVHVADNLLALDGG